LITLIESNSFAIGDEAPAINPEQAQAVEPIAVRQPPFVAYPDDILELAKQAQSPKPRVLKEAQSKFWRKHREQTHWPERKGNDMILGRILYRVLVK
jgi:hypothetical protein